MAFFSEYGIKNNQNLFYFNGVLTIKWLCKKSYKFMLTISAKNNYLTEISVKLKIVNYIIKLCKD